MIPTAVGAVKIMKGGDDSFFDCRIDEILGRKLMPGMGTRELMNIMVILLVIFGAAK